MKRVLFNLFMICGLFLATNCRQEAVEQLGCDCEGKATARIMDAVARIPNGGKPHIMLKEAAISGNRYTKEFIVCNSEKITGLPASGDYDYLVSGNLRPDCMQTSLPKFWRLDITSIRQK